VTIFLAAADKRKLRRLSTGSLSRLLLLSRAFGLTLEPKLCEPSLDLLPGDLRGRLKQQQAQWHRRRPQWRP